MKNYPYKIKLVDLERQNKFIGKKILSRIEQVIKASDFILGEEVEIFEKKFARFVGKKYAVGLNSGTDAIKFAMIAYGVRPGDQIITVSNGYFSVASSIVELGCKAVFVDVRKDSLLMDVDKIENLINKKTKGIIPVHLFGQSVEMDRIVSLAKKYDLFIIEDACQAHGAKYKNVTLPYTETGAFSFYPGKNLGCFGDGGILVTDNEKIATQIKYLRNDGSVDKYIHPQLGFKSRLDTIQAAVLNCKLQYLNKWNAERVKIAKMYTKLLSSIPGITVPTVLKDNAGVFHLYVIRLDNRDQLREYLSTHGVETGIHYPTPIHLQEPFRNIGYKPGDFPVTEDNAGKILSLPIFPELEGEEVEYICKLIKEFTSKK